MSKFNKLVEEIFSTKPENPPEWKKEGGRRFISEFTAPNGVNYQIEIENNTFDLMERLEDMFKPSDLTSNPFNTQEQKDKAKEIYDYTDPTSEDEGIYHVSFTSLDFYTKQKYNKSADQWGLTQTGSAAAVFSIVIELMKDFVAKKTPSILYFISHEESRTRLYRAMLRRLADALGWDWMEGKNWDDSLFILTRK